MSKFTILSGLSTALWLASLPALASEPALAELTISNAQQQMQQGLLTSEQLTHYYLQQIQQKNHQGPALHAFNDVNRDALKLAKRLDAERTSSRHPCRLKSQHCHQ